MTTSNPYRAPASIVKDVDKDDFDDAVDLALVASGQKVVIFSLVASIAGGIALVGFGNAARSVAPFLQLALWVCALFGVLRLAKGLGRSVLARVVYAVALFIPLVNIIVMVALSMQGTKALREAGYQVGFFGAKNL